MSCPTCDHTMHGIGYGMFHCPRCGTLTGAHADGSVTVPALVERVRTFYDLHYEELRMDQRAAWHRIGIGEASDAPDDRPKPPEESSR